MPAKSERARRFFGAEISRKKKGRKRKTGMFLKKLKEFARKRKK